MLTHAWLVMVRVLRMLVALRLLIASAQSTPMQHHWPMTILDYAQLVLVLVLALIVPL